MVPRENKNNVYSKFGGTNKEYYGISRSSLLVTLHRNQIILTLIITMTIFSNLTGALTALFFTNYCVGLKSDSEIGQLAEIG